MALNYCTPTTRFNRHAIFKSVVLHRFNIICENSTQFQCNPVETSGVYFGSLKTFLLSVKLENIRIGTHLNILVTHNSKRKANRYFRACNMLTRNNANVTHCEKTQCFIFKTKCSRQASRSKYI